MHRMATAYTYRPTPEVEQFIEDSIKASRRSAQAEIQLIMEFYIREKSRKRKKKNEDGLQ